MSGPAARMLVAVALLSALACNATGADAPVADSSPGVTAGPASPTAGTPGPEVVTTPAPVPSAAGSSDCPVDVQAHTYHPQRLLTLAPCVTVSGTVEVIRHEADGDAHILLRVDPGQPVPASSGCDGTANPCSSWINSMNTSAQHGDLIVEPECEYRVTQADAVSACQDYGSPLALPAIGQHVSVTGPWVLDQQHGWLEIHPVVRFG